MRTLRLCGFLIPWLWLAHPAGASETAHPISWRGWDADLFVQAKAQQRFVILDLEAVWCHWCHVMDEKTYHNAEVVRLINAHFIAVRVDQDADPALSLRYEDYGWPATIMFAPNGTEIARLQGYLAPELMVRILNAIIEDPSPGPSITEAVKVKPSGKAFFSPAQRERLTGNHRFVYDPDHGGWGSVHKFIHFPSLEFALREGAGGGQEYEKMARQTLDAALALIDPVWGGVYQYSDEVDWQSPHYEKIMQTQTWNLRAYAQGFGLYGDARYLKAARDVYRYLTGFLRGPKGAFYTSQDADVNEALDGKAFYALDDKQRRAQGLPRIDKNRYARENGWVIEALVALYQVTGDVEVLEAARNAARWVLEHRATQVGGFRHGAQDRGGPFLGDNLAVGRAMLSLYAATGTREWLTHARRAADFTAAHFTGYTDGLISAPVDPSAQGVFAEPVRHIDENIDAVRFANLLHRYTGEVRYRELAHTAMRYLAAPAITNLRRFLAGALLADRELAQEPAHITVVGHKDDPRAAKLYAAALRYPATYKITEWWDKREGPLPNPEISYPQLDRPAAFACANQACSLPVFEADEIAQAVRRTMEVQ